MDIGVSGAATVLVAMYFPASWRRAQRKWASSTQMCTITDLQPLCNINYARYKIVFQGVPLSSKCFQEATGFNIISTWVSALITHMWWSVWQSSGNVILLYLCYSFNNSAAVKSFLKRVPWGFLWALFERTLPHAPTLIPCYGLYKNIQSSLSNPRRPFSSWGPLESSPDFTALEMALLIRFHLPV